MALQLTETSAIEYEKILYGRMTPRMAAAYLQEERISIRSFSETLKQMFPSEALARRLRDFYKKHVQQENPGSVDRKIQNWVSGRNHPTNREDYFRIAFALDLTEDKLNFLLGICTDYAVQYRNGQEAVLSWFLRNGLSYSQALRFLDTLPRPAGTEEDHILEELHAGTDFMEKYPYDSEHGFTEISRITHEVRNEFLHARNPEELRDCYLRNLDRFGRLHLRSYYYLRHYLKQLIQPNTFFEESELDYSIETVMETYLTMHMPAGKNLRRYSLVQRLIKHNWPNATTIRRILNQKEDVPRKLLILLYVVTENSDLRAEYREIDEEYISLEERVEDHWWTLNALLAECGMAPLDLRNAFDWLIMYAISSSGEESMSSRLEEVIDELFKT